MIPGHDLPSSPERAALMFPILENRLIARIAAHGATRPVRAGDVLIQAGEPDPRFFVHEEREGGSRPALQPG